MMNHLFFSSCLLHQGISTTYPSDENLTSDASSPIGHGMKSLRSRSEENLTKLAECMKNLDEDIANLFIECDKTVFREDPESLRLLSQYFITSEGVSQCCQSLRKLLDRAECFLMDKLFHDFQEEKKRYDKTVSAPISYSSELYNSGDDCDDDGDFLSGEGEFLKKINTCHEDLAKAIVNLEAAMTKIDKKLKHVPNRGMAAVCVSKFVRWRKSTKTLKLEKASITITTMERALVALKEIEKIGRLVNRLEIVERSVRVTADIAVKKQASVVAAMEETEEERKRLKSALVLLHISSLMKS